MATKVKALKDLALRKSADPQSPLYEQWHNLEDGSSIYPACSHEDRPYDRERQVRDGTASGGE